MRFRSIIWRARHKVYLVIRRESLCKARWTRRWSVIVIPIPATTSSTSHRCVHRIGGAIIIPISSSPSSTSCIVSHPTRSVRLAIILLRLPSSSWFVVRLVGGVGRRGGWEFVDDNVRRNVLAGRRVQRCRVLYRLDDGKRALRFRSEAALPDGMDASIEKDENQDRDENDSPQWSIPTTDLDRFRGLLASVAVAASSATPSPSPFRRFFFRAMRQERAQQEGQGDPSTHDRSTRSLESEHLGDLYLLMKW